MNEKVIITYPASEEDAGNYRRRAASHDAKNLLAYYLSLLFAQANLNFDSDNRAEIELLIDNIIIAAGGNHESKK